MLGRTAFLDRNNKHAGFPRQIVKANDAPMERHILSGDADVTAPNFGVFDQPASHEPCGVARDRETDSLRRPDHCRVHTDHFAGGVHQRSPGVAGVQRRVSLNDIVDQTARLGIHGTSKCADNSRRHAGLKTERVADRDHQLPDPQIFRISQPHVDKLRRIDANHRKICFWIVANQPPGILAAVRQIDRDLCRVMHDMAVGQNESIGRDHESGAAAANFARALSASPLLFDIDVDHGRRDALRDAYDCARIFVEQGRVTRGGDSRHGRRSGRGAGVM